MTDKLLMGSFKICYCIPEYTEKNEILFIKVRRSGALYQIIIIDHTLRT